VLAYNPARHTAAAAGTLPVPVSNAASAVIGGTAFVVGGSDGTRQVPTVAQVRLVPDAAAFPGTDPAGAPGTRPGVHTDAYDDESASSAPWLQPAHGTGHLAPHSDPAALPGDILIADDWNNRLLIVDPQGRVRWKFPRPGDLAPGQHFNLPDDAFFSPNGKDIIATEEEYSVVSVISIAKHKIIYRYGHPGVPGSAAGSLSNPDDAMMLPGGDMITADIKNCRVLLLAPPSRQVHRPRRILGTTGVCGHAPPHEFGSPNGAFPATNGRYIFTEISGDWATEMSLAGRVAWSAHPPGVAYPSDTNEVYPGRYLTADYSPAGQVVEFDSHGRLLWRFRGLNHPSLALPLPNGDILVNDDYNDRVIVIDPVTDKIVWQYGHTGVARTAPGYLNDPDGVDLVPPDSMLITHAATMGRP
jgi:outer membrane protein assembly factor BamB